MQTAVIIYQILRKLENHETRSFSADYSKPNFTYIDSSLNVKDNITG